jgi:hypothetical protein
MLDDAIELNSKYPSSIFHPDKMNAIIRAVLPFLAVFSLTWYQTQIMIGFQTFGEFVVPFA